MEKIKFYFIYIFTVILVIPYLFTINNKKNFDFSQSYVEEKNYDNLENYIVGVVAAEMPSTFEKEALKAQAVAARTYAVRNAEDINNIKPETLGQAYITVDKMKENWQENFDANYKKICGAVEETRGEILTYNEEPILAAFHAISAGQTEESQNIWTQSLDYLKTTDSHLDKNAPNYLTQVSVTREDFIKKLAIKDINFTLEDILILRTQAGYVKELKIKDKIFKGTEIRSIFSLRSACFEISEEEDNIIFTVRGYGHGAGMSQWGANFLAKDNFDYREILNHYYKGVEITDL